MSQNVIKQIALESSDDAIASAPLSVDTYAERLMDELFEDVDRALDSSVDLPTETVQPEVVSLKPVTVPQIILPPTMLPQPDENRDEEAIARQVAIAVAKKQQPQQSFDKILLGAAFASLVLILGLWAASRSRFWQPQPATTTTIPNPTAANAKAQADVEFGNYVQKSLDAIDQKKATQTNAQTPNLPGVPPATNLPSISVSGAPPATAGIASALNRMADAMEQTATQPQNPSTQVVVIPPAVTAATPGTPQASSPSPSPSRTGVGAGATIPPLPSRTMASPPPAASPLGKILAREPEAASAPATTEATAPLPPAPSSTEALPVPASQTPTVAHTLVGVLELGNRSAALFEIDGVARRIYVGESIGASGWTLAEVKNQEAVIRRGGEVRSIFVGQKF